MLSFPWQQPLTVVILVRTIWMLERGGQNRVRYPTYSTYSLRSSKYNAIQANAEIKSLSSGYGPGNVTRTIVKIVALATIY